MSVRTRFLSWRNLNISVINYFDFTWRNPHIISQEKDMVPCHKISYINSNEFFFSNHRLARSVFLRSVSLIPNNISNSVRDQQKKYAESENVKSRKQLFTCFLFFWLIFIRMMEKWFLRDLIKQCRCPVRKASRKSRQENREL